MAATLINQSKSSSSTLTNVAVHTATLANAALGTPLLKDILLSNIQNVTLQELADVPINAPFIAKTNQAKS